MNANRPFELEIPADPAWLGVGRTFSAAVAELAGLPPELTEDVRLAVSEGLSSMIALREVAPADGALRISMRQDEALHVHIEDLGISHAGAVDAEHHATISDIGIARLDVVRALFEDFVADTTPAARLRITFSVPQPDAA